ERLLKIVEQEAAYNKNSIDGTSVLRIARLLWAGTLSVKALILFKLFDYDNNNRVSLSEMKTFYQQYLKEFKFPHNENRTNEIIDIFLTGFHFDDDDDQQINFDQFYTVLQSNDELLHTLYLISIPDQHLLISNLQNKISHHCCTREYIKNNLNRIICLFIYILVNLSLIIYVVVYRLMMAKLNGWEITARIGGELINFNFSFSFLLMLKQTITLIRSNSFLRHYVPVDNHIDLHKIVGTVIAVSSIVHSLALMINYTVKPSEYTWIQQMFTTIPQYGWINGTAPITGIVLFILLFIMVLCAMQFVRQKTGYYQLFYYTHLLYVPLFILLIIHSRDFWKWFIGPIVLFSVEKLYSFKRCFGKYGLTYLLSVTIEDENVLSLIIYRPHNFSFNIGDYIFINFPLIASYEWHPFTISSGPEEKNFLRLHIQKQKNWTKKLHDYFTNYSKQRDSYEKLVDTVLLPVMPEYTRIQSPKIIEFNDQSGNKQINLRIDGPYSSCTRYIFDCEHCVLIGGGIGITPYVSVLESLMYQFRSQRMICSNCSHMNYTNEFCCRRTLKKVDFIWINRDVKNFGWFIKLLSDFEVEQETYLNANPEHERYLDIHLYFTSLASNETNRMGNVAYDLVANVYSQISHKDMYTNLKTKTRIGRPNWKLLFSKLKVEQKNRTTSVFFCGNKTMGQTINQQCQEQNFLFHSEPFDK
ncbi:unnamed protein product, partial [Didymodactylos carnosus]